ncbi:hypothetical protein ABEB36_009281 [Hypothenemus hampei]|uniref:MADF domain-containing protein n=1 Tax=Hypothenemus hampei TaxID=57062 RepID=A0ABD1EFW3_HYPHA
MNDGKLIDLVHSYPHLYDRKISDFKDVKKKENSWKEIASLTNYSGNRKRNASNLPSSSAAFDKRPWDLLESLQWLEPYMQKRRSKSSLEASSIHETDNVFEDVPIHINTVGESQEDAILIEEVECPNILEYLPSCSQSESVARYEQRNQINSKFTSKQEKN